MTIHTLYELVQHSVKSFASKVAFAMYGGEELSYAEVGTRVKHVQDLLIGAGLKAGDKVALLSSNMPNWGVCYFAVTSAGMIAVPILPDFSGEELDMIIEHSEARALLVSDKLFTKLSKETIGRLNVVVRTKNLGVISQRVRGEGSTGVPRPDDLAVLIYTSGTTSKPKGVMLTHAALCAQVDISASIFPVDGGDTFLSVLPLSHTYECSIGMIYPFSMGARVVYLDRPPTASVLMPALRAIRPTVMLIVPLIIEKIYRHQVLAKFNSNSFWRTLYRIGFMRRYLHRVAGGKLMKLFGGRLRFLGIGGAKLDGGAEKFLLEARVPYAIGYGLTETAPLLAGAAPSMVRLGSTGPQAPGVELRLENVNPETRQGEIVARTPRAIEGYFKNPEATKEVFTADGWFRTGDLGELDKDGWLYIKGRLKNMIVGPGGENIYPEDIETVRNCHLAEYYGTRLHMCHVSTKESVDTVRMSRMKGARVSCEVTPHHLWFDDSRLTYRVNPPIRKADDVNALIDAIKDGTVTCIGTDHAPHTAEEKEKGAAGMVGLETAFGVCYTKLCREQRIPLEMLSFLMSAGPAAVLGLADHKGLLEPGYDADIVLVDIDHMYEVHADELHSKSKNCPYDGALLYGKVVTTIKGGKVTFQIEE